MINSLNSQDLKSSSFDQIFESDAYICVEIDVHATGIVHWSRITVESHAVENSGRQKQIVFI